MVKALRLIQWTHFQCFGYRLHNAIGTRAVDNRELGKGRKGKEKGGEMRELERGERMERRKGMRGGGG